MKDIILAAKVAASAKAGLEQALKLIAPDLPAHHDPTKIKLVNAVEAATLALMDLEAMAREMSPMPDRCYCGTCPACATDSYPPPAFPAVQASYEAAQQSASAALPSDFAGQ